MNRGTGGVGGRPKPLRHCREFGGGERLCSIYFGAVGFIYDVKMEAFLGA